LLFARPPYGPSHRTHSLELRAEYVARLEVLFDPEAEERDRIEAQRWINWYEQPEYRLTDLGDHAQPMTFNGQPPSSAVLRLASRRVD
jgi:hypothetical protein